MGLVKGKKYGEVVASLFDPDRDVDGRTPVCGDELRLTIRLEGDTLTDIAFIGNGCSISQASASLLATDLRGRSISEARTRIRAIHDLIDHLPHPDLGLLESLKVVEAFPARRPCARLAWNLLSMALGDPLSKSRS